MASGLLAVLVLWSAPESASASCGLFDSSCSDPTLSVAGQVFVALVVVVIVGSLIWWRFGSGGPLARFLLWRARRRSR
jgi:hypothetical protein